MSASTSPTSPTKQASNATSTSCEQSKEYQFLKSKRAANWEQAVYDDQYYAVEQYDKVAKCMKMPMLSTIDEMISKIGDIYDNPQFKNYDYLTVFRAADIMAAMKEPDPAVNASPPPSPPTILPPPSTPPSDDSGMDLYEKSQEERRNMRIDNFLNEWERRKYDPDSPFYDYGR
jgi:hypothetical protein